MAVFIELTTDAFEAAFQRQLSSQTMGGARAGTGKRVARRPMRGIEIKDDTYAIIKVIRADGREIPLFDSSTEDGRSKNGNSNFLLQQVQESRMEKHQILETFGESYVFFFGENPRFVDCQAVLLNSLDFNWLAEWNENYDRYLRGTKLVEMGARMYLFYGDVILEGYMLNSQKVENVQQPYQAGLTFRLFVTNYRNLGFIDAPENTAFPTRSSVEIPDGIDLTADGSPEALISAYRGQLYDQSEAESFGPQASSILRSFDTGENPFVSGTKITDLIRKLPRSVGVSEELWSELLNNPEVNPYSDPSVLLVTRNGQPLRGRIIDNTDEYTGMDSKRVDIATGEDLSNPYTQLPLNIVGSTRSQLESEDLFQQAIEALSCFGADINSPASLTSLGMGVSVSASASAGAGGASAVAEAEAFAGFQQEPLGAVYGRSASSATSFEATAEASYGYGSDFADGKPGFGVTGYGDLGGGGFGSAMGAAGDPGFKDPADFTFAGVADNRGAYQRFLERKKDTTALGGTGLQTGFGTFGASGSVSAGISGGASVGIGGSISAFAFVSVNGSLDPTGNARSNPAAIAAHFEQTKFGFSIDNPFGVNCSPRSDSLQDVQGEDLSNPYNYGAPQGKQGEDLTNPYIIDDGSDFFNTPE